MASLPCVSSHVPSSGQLLASLPCGSGPMVSMLILLLSRFVHLNGFSPAWFLLCSFKWPVIGKILSYFEHLKGFSPLWVWSRGEYVEKLLSQFLHLHGFSPIWVLHVPSSGQDWDYLVILWASKMSHGEYVDKPFSLFVHLNGFSPVWVLLCSFKCPVIGKILSYFEHLKGFSPVWVLQVQRDALVTLIAL